MPNQVFALLVGINDYPAPVRKLTGCVNDVDHFHDYLKQGFGSRTLAVEMLKDGDATRENVIRQFRKHLGRAKAGDVALFQYCGHGAQSVSAGAFREFDLAGLDEGLVCVDSRLPGGHDLADKELALLIDELSESQAHVAFILDSCHSGSGTRSADAFGGLQSRLTQGVSTERPLESYLDGHYVKLLKKGERLAIPQGRHMLLAACERRQEAKESPTEHRGVFSTTLLEVLEASGGNLSYADLFLRCRAAVRKRAQDQDPQFEPIGQFNPWSGFLGGQGGRQGRTFRVSFDRKAWRINCGAIHGMPTDPDKSVGVVLYGDKDSEHPIGTAQTLEVGTNDAILDIGALKADPALSYNATITSLPVAPLLVHCAADSSARAALDKALADNQAIGAALATVPDTVRYGLEVEGDLLRLVQRESGVLIQAAQANKGSFDSACVAMLAVLRQVAQWERSLALQNQASQIDPALIDFVCSEPVEGATDFIHPGDTVTLESVKERGGWSAIAAQLLVRNRTKRPLHRVLVYFSPAYGIQVTPTEEFDPGEEYTSVLAPAEGFHMEEGTVAESVDRFKLIVSTQPIDGFLLMQEDLELGATLPITRSFGGDLTGKSTRKARQDDWLTKDLRVRVVPRLNELGDKSWTSANGVVVVKGHPKVKAKLTMTPAKGSTRGAGEGAAFLDAFERAGLMLPSFSNTRGDNPNVLELSDIQGGESLKDHPLEIEIDLPLGPDEGILPFVFDGQHVLLGGDACKDDAGRTQIRIDHLHEQPKDTRSLGGSLKMYFVKTYLKRPVNQLRWLDYGAEGGFAQRDSGTADKVAAAKRVLLLVHGIIGDTEGMAAGIRACGLDQKFDLVLSYDYENLSTPIEQTAKDLKAQLAAVGLSDDDDKHLTLLVHSMGGLVSRWFIEREGGNRLVDHLVMCGTPNNGSPFGKIDEARQILNMLTGLAANYVPTLIPFSAPILFLLNRSKRVTPTLMQMDPSSEFIRNLNASPDPGIPYTILAGDVDAYREPTDDLFAKLLAKTGRSLLFDALFANKANDIAVSIDSITGVGRTRAKVPKSGQVACHHLNYFVSQAGQEALMAGPW